MRKSLAIFSISNFPEDLEFCDIFKTFFKAVVNIKTKKLCLPTQLSVKVLSKTASKEDYTYQYICSLKADYKWALTTATWWQRVIW